MCKTMKEYPASSFLRTARTAAVLLFAVLGGCRDSGSHCPVVGPFPHRFDAPNGEASLLFKEDNTSSFVVWREFPLEGYLGKWTVQSNTVAVKIHGMPLTFRADYRSDGRMRLVVTNASQRSSEMQTFMIANVYIEHRGAVGDRSEDVKP